MGANSRLSKIIGHLDAESQERLHAALNVQPTSSNSPQIFGFCDPEYSSVRKAFEANLKSGREDGASVCIYRKGKCVVDLWGSKTGNWKSDSIVNVYSCTKGLAALCVHMLVDRGLLDIDKPVAYYWPGFEKKNKQNITLRHCLSHSAGLRGVSGELPTDAANHWDVMCKALEEEEPEYELGSGRHGYHALTFGWLVGEVIRRVTGKTVGEFFLEEVGRPFGVDFLCGVKEEKDHARILDVIEPEIEMSPEMEALIKTSIPGFHVNSRETRTAEIPAANGHSNARGLARMYAILAQGGQLEGKHLISQNAIDYAIVPQVKGMDETIGMETVWSNGFMRFALPDPSAFGHAGYGGSIGFADPNHELSFGYAPNKLWLPSAKEPGDVRLIGLLGALYKDLKKM